MKNRKKQTGSTDRWLKKPLLSGRMQPWLQDSQSLTLRLQQRYCDFCVVPLRVSYANAFYDEASILNIPPHHDALLRDVFLQGNGQTVVFAHSVLPKKTLRGRWLGLKHLGAKPLGAALFASPQIKRTALRYKKLGFHDPLAKLVRQRMQKTPKVLWARRSLFIMHSAQVMVTEIFLPQLLQSQ